MANLLFKQGLYSSEMFGDGKVSGSSIKNFSEGTIYVVTDQKAIYLDTYQNKAATTENQKRIRIQGLVQYYESVNEWSQSVKPPYSSDVIYFIASENAFMRYDDSQVEGSKWVQLNTTTQTANKLLSLINDNQTAIDDHEDRLSVVEKAIGSGSAEGSILDRLDQAESDINNIELKDEAQDGRLDAIENTLGNTQTTPGTTTVLGRLGSAEGNINTLQDTVSDHSDLLATIGGANGTGGEIKKLADRATSLETAIGSDDTTGSVKGRIKALEGRADATENAIGTENTAGTILYRIKNAESINNTQDSTLKDHGDLLTVIGGETGTGGEIKKLADRATGLETRATDLETRATDLETAIGSDSVGNSVKGRIKALEDAKANHDSLLEGLRTDVDNNEDAISSLQTNSATKTELATLKSQLENADTALHGALTTLSGDYQAVKKDYGDRIATLETAKGEQTDEIAGIKNRVNTIENDLNTATTGLKARMNTAEGEIDTLQAGVQTINNKIGSESTPDSILYRIKNAENDIDSLQTDFSDFEDAVEQTYATKTELTTTEQTLQKNIDDHIKAANAMVYKEGVTSWANLNTKAAANTELSIGHTYIATSNFTDSKTGYNKVYAGDLLIATGTEDANGKLTTSNVVWVHVSSGYVLEHMPELAIKDNKITLTSLNGNGEVGDLGEFNIVSSSSNVTVSLTEASGSTLGAVTVGLVWDTF